MLPSPTSAIVDSHDEYAVADALGSPLPAPSRSYVYIVTVEKDYSLIVLQAAASSVMEAERVVTEYVVRNMYDLFRYSAHWLPLDCPACGNTTGAPFDLQTFAEAYQRISEGKAAALAGRNVETYDGPTLFKIQCRIPHRKEITGKDLSLDLAAASSEYLYTFSAVQQMMRNVKGRVTFAKALVDSSEESEIVK